MEGSKTSTKTFALLDEGSTITLIDEKLRRDIGIRGEKVNLILQGVNNEKIMINDSEKINFSVIGSFGKFKVKGAIAVKNLKLPTQSISNEFVCNLQKIEKDLCIEPYENPQVNYSNARSEGK